MMRFFFSGELVQIMMATANENLSAKFCNRVLKFFTKLFQLSKFTVGIYLKSQPGISTLSFDQLEIKISLNVYMGSKNLQYIIIL